jgi:hypothetical protein
LTDRRRPQEANVTLASYPAGRYLVPNRRNAAPQEDITGWVKALVRLLSVTVAGLLVWIVMLGLRLPAADVTRQSKLLWVGFDTAEAVALGVTLWAVYRSRQLAIPAALIAGTLFACDAWFDVVLSWRTPGWWFSLAGAVLLELPLTVLLWGSARAMVHVVIARQFAENMQLTSGLHLRELELFPSEHPPEDRRRSGSGIASRLND